MNPSKESEGWNWLYNSRKDHYFVNGQSLCGHWLCLSSKDLSEHSDNKCKRCEQLAERRKQEKENERTSQSAASNS